jgi:hypothetical protein
MRFAAKSVSTGAHAEQLKAAGACTKEELEITEA